MPDMPADQLSVEEELRKRIQHPDFGAAPPPDANIVPGGTSTHNPAGYNPADVPDPAASYARAWNQQFSSQPAATATPAPDNGQPPLPPAQAPELAGVPRDDKGRFTKLYAGKYHSPEDLESAYIHNSQETQRIMAERDALKGAMTLLNQQQLFRSREPERPEPVKVSVPTEGEPFVNPQQLDAYVEQRARQVAAQQIQETLGPILRSNQALNTVRATYPDFQQHESDFTKWLSLNPELAAKVANDPDIGMDYAYLKFQRERGATLAQAAQAQTAQAQPQIDQARQHAAPPQASRNEPSADQSRNKQLQELYEYGRQTGDWKPYQNARLKEAIPGWHVQTEWGKP